MKQHVLYSFRSLLIFSLFIFPFFSQAGVPGSGRITEADKLVNVNIYGGTNAYSNTAWNNWNVGTAKATNKSITALKYSDGTSSTIGAVLSSTEALGDNGSTYGGTMAPTEVLRYCSNATTSRTLTLSGLSTTKTYSLELYASRAKTGYSSIFTIGTTTVTVNTDNNKTTKASFTNLKANSSGQIVVTIKSGTTANTSPYNYLNGFVITETGENTTPGNQSPTANAGTDKTITLPTNSTSLTGSSSDADGTIVSSQWSQISGPNQATLSTPSAASTNISGLIAGTYTFRFTVTDNSSATSYDEVNVIVKSAATTEENVFNPNDPVVNYDPANPPTKPASGKVGKWVRTPRVSWNTSSFKCYIYNGMAFRLKFPKNYDATKAYPILIFFHGKGEYGTIYDNEFHLYLGGSAHANAVDNGKFNGFLLYPQHTSEFWSSGNIANVNSLIEQVMIPKNMVDPFRVYVNGLSAGGGSTWMFLSKYTKLVAAATPISSAQGYSDSVYKYKFTPVWHFQGQLDPDPTPTESRRLGTKILAAGANYKYKEFANRAHDCWNQAWAEDDYFPFYARAYKSNPWPLNGRTEFCQGEVIRDTLGVTPGFEGYEWRKNGVLIQGATSNVIYVTEYGTYDCRIKKGTTWSLWSPTPIVIKVKATTVQPTITVSGAASNVIPAPDGSTTAPLEVPDGYVAYNWQKEGSATVLSTTRFLNAATPGNYKVHVTEKWGCATSADDFSQPFQVVNANGNNGPDAVTALSAKALSKTSIQLSWSQTTSPAYNETGFEVYEATASDGPYTYKLKTTANATGVTITSLNSGTTYYYKVRAVNGNAASSVAGPASEITLSDKTPPSTPLSLRIGSLGRSAIELIWNASSDDVGVTNYEIFINGVKSFVYGKVTKGTAYNLLPAKSYTFTVRARDQAGNVSAFSNAAVASTTSGSLKVDQSMGSNPANYSFYLNLNLDNQASAPWNNTNVLPSEGTVFSTLKSYASNNSGAKMTIVDNFSGYNPGGMITGNNSGVYPDNVMRSMYYCDQGQVAKLKFSGLSVNHKFSFIFFGSRNRSGDLTSVYKIGNQSVSLNASMNTTKTVQIDNVLPDQDGNVYIEVSLGATSVYAYLNSIVVKAYSLGGGSAGTSTTAATETNGLEMLPETSTDFTEARAYPNPAQSHVTLAVPLQQNASALTVNVTDAAGSILSTQNFRNVSQGLWQQRISLQGRASQPGVYFIKITGLPEGKSQVLKVVKVK